MRRYSILRAIPLSFFSSDLYRDVATSWRGIGLVFQLLLAAFLTLLVLVRIYSALNLWVHREGQQLADQVPKIVIRHRVVEVDRAMPYVIRDSDMRHELAIIDTTGRITSLDSLEASVLLTADRVVMRKSSAETRIVSLSGVENFSLSSDRVKHWLKLLSIWGPILAAPFVLGGLFVVRLIQALAFACAGLLVARLAKADLDFDALLRVAAVALTPATFVDTALGLARHKPAGWGVIWITIVFAYLVWGVIANRRAAGASVPPAGPV